jgi:arylsulfatase A-like enzyme
MHRLPSSLAPTAPLLTSLSVLLATVSCGEPFAPSPPDVFLIVVDTLRADHLGCYGYERDTSPHIDRLAAEGVRFERAVSQAPWTTPSIGSLLTSRYPSEIGIHSERSVLSDDLVLLPEVLREHGYATAAVVSHHFCSSRWNFDQGFDTFDESNVKGHAAVTSEDVTRSALELVDEHPGGERPLFLWVHYFDPHFAYVGHDEHPFAGSPDYDGPVRDGLEYKYLFRMRGALAEEDMDELRRFYDSEIAHTDRWIGALFDGLRERGRWDDALVIFTADHGEEFLDHGGLGHSRTVFDEAVRVPLIVKRPGASGAGDVVARPVPLLDVFPTVLEHAGIESPPDVAGASLFAAAAGGPVVTETARKGGVRGLVADGYKLVHRVEEGTFVLYDLARDPGETRDVAAERPTLARRLRSMLEQWERATESRAAVEIELGVAELEALRQLGYAGADEDPEAQETEGTESQ